MSDGAENGDEGSKAEAVEAFPHSLAHVCKVRAGSKPAAVWGMSEGVEGWRWAAHWQAAEEHHEAAAPCILRGPGLKGP